METKESYDTIDIFLYLWKKRKPIIIVTVFGAIISIIVSLMLPNYYKAQTVLFPTTFLSPSTSVLNKTNTHKTDPLIIGDEDDLERMIQMLNSDFITNRIIQKYNLISHYGLDPADPHLRTKLLKTFHSNVSYKKTHYQGVLVSVVDIDPKIAASIANDISSLLDSLVFDMQKQRAKEEYEVALKAYNDEKAYVTHLEDSLQYYRNKGVLYYEHEVERYSEAYGNAVALGKLSRSGKKFFDEKFKTLAKYGVPANGLLVYLEFVKDNLSQLHLNLTQAKENLQHPVTHKYVISKAAVPDKKAFPKRSVIVIFSTIGAFIFALAIVLFLDFFKEFRNRIKED